MVDNEQSVTDASPEVSSTPAESPSQSEAAPAAKETNETPFHEHPRFKELINQRNEFSSKLQEYEKRFQELNSRFEQSAPKPQTPESKLLERLKGIDPEFGTWAEQQHQAKTQLESKLAQFEQWKADQESTAHRTQLQSSLEKLHSEHKVPDSMRQFYEARLQAEAQRNPHLKLTDLPNVYKGIHSEFSKFMESREREILSSYSQSKAKDSSVPASPKGNSPKPGTTQKTEYSKDPQEARAQVVKNALKALRNN